MPSNPEPPRHDSIGALDDNDRALLNRVLVTAKSAIDSSKADRERLEARLEAEAKERIALEGKVISRFSDYDQKLQASDTKIQGMADDVAELKGLSGDIRGLRGDISSLNSNVTQNLNMDAVRDQKTAALELKVQAIASEEGRDAGKTAGRKGGAVWGTLAGGTAGPLVFAFLVWLISTIIAAVQGKPPPAFPQIAPPATSSSGH